MGFHPIPGPAVPIIVTSILFTTIAFVVVCLRIYTRALVTKIAGTDDYIMCVAMVASIGFFITIMEQVRWGLGMHFDTIPLQNLENFFQSLWIIILMYNLVLTFTKISIIFQYKRIFTQKNVRQLCNVMIGVLIVYGCWTFFGSLFMCIPAAAFWDQSLKGKCMNRLAFWFSNAALNITTDLMIFAIPMPLLRQLQLPKKQKIGLMFVFGFGAFVCVTSVIRLKSLYEISVSTDTSLDGVNAGIWSGIEINVGIACASLLALKPLISKVMPGFLSNLTTKGSLGSVDESANTKMSALRSRRQTQTEEIKVVQSVYQKTDALPSSSRKVRGVW